MDLLALAAKLTLDTASYASSLTNAETSANTFGTRLEAIFDKAGKVLKTSAIVVTVTKLSKQFWSMANSTAEYADAVDKGSQRLGISTKAYQTWGHALEQSGSSIDELSIGIKNINSILSGTAGDELSAAFDKLGISTKDANGNMRSTEETLQDVLLSLSGMESSAERANLVTALFGKGGANLNAFLNTGAEGIQDLIDEAYDLGLVMSDDKIQKGVAFGDAVANMNAAVESLKNTVASGLIGPLQKGVELITDIVAFVNKLLKGENVDFSAIGQRIIDILTSVLNSAAKLIGPLVNMFVQIIKSPDFWNAVLELGKALLNALVQGLASLFGIEYDPGKKAREEAANAERDRQAVIDRKEESKLDQRQNITNLIEEAKRLMEQGVAESDNKALGKLKYMTQLNARDYMLKYDTTIEDAQQDLIKIQSELEKLTGKTYKIDLMIDTYGMASTSGMFDGFHASGLNYVPYDNYIACLHRGEQVLTASQARSSSSAVDVDALASAVASAVSASLAGMAVTMDGQEVGNIVTGTVSKNLAAQLRSGRY